MNLRRAAVAGYYYPAEREALAREIDRLFVGAAPAGAAAALVVPHGGLRFSGAVAAAAYGAVRVPALVIVLGPNHAGHGAPAAIQRDGAWETPLGEVPVDQKMTLLLERESRLFQADVAAHLHEHAIEVQLPFLQRRNPAVRFVPIAVSTTDPNELRTIGDAVAAAALRAGEETLLVASSDLSHGETDETARVRDALVRGDIEALDAAALLEHVAEVPVAMCGAGAVAAVLRAARARGATVGRLAAYATSGDVSGDRSRVVGYAGMVLS